MCGAIAGPESEKLLTQVLFMWLTPHATADTFSVMSAAGVPESLLSVSMYLHRSQPYNLPLTNSPPPPRSPNKHAPMTLVHPIQGHVYAVDQQNWQCLL